MKTNYTMRDMLHAISVLQEDKDVFVDGTDVTIAVVGTDGIRLTPAALERFKDALELPVEGAMIYGTDEDYELYERNGTGRLALAIELLYALAGYCSSVNYTKWFEGEKTELI